MGRNFRSQSGKYRPRYFSRWSAGVSPRDLYRLCEDSEVNVQYHRDYPAAFDPVPQFVLFSPVRVRSLRMLRYAEVWKITKTSEVQKDRPNQELVNEALLMAAEQRRPKPGFIHHRGFCMRAGVM